MVKRRNTETKSGSGEVADMENAVQKKGRLAWGVMAPEEMKRPGAEVIALIFEAANNRQMTPSEVLDELGISYSHFSSLRSGEKAIPRVGEDFLERIAKFLSLPKVSVKLAAGQLEPKDFYHDAEKVVSYLLPSLKFIQRDPEYGPTMPLSLLSADPRLQLFVVNLYEKATGRTIIPSKVSIEQVANRFNDLANNLSEK